MNFTNAINDAREIIERAINQYNPSHVVCLYSGGKDSWVMTHVAHQILKTPPLVYSIDTMMSADGWRDYVTMCAERERWRHDIYTNRSGYRQWVEWVASQGCPYSTDGHKKTYARLKDRGLDAILRQHKTHRLDKVLFLSGIRRAESVQRGKFTDPVFSRPRSSQLFANPLFNWANDQTAAYAIEHDMPINPFYETVGGSGDCQCNWGNFIDLDTLKRHSPKLAERVADLDDLSRTEHGWGWDEAPDYKSLRLVKAGQMQLDYDPSFLCAGCERSRVSKPGQSEAAAAVALAREEW